jgi:hypothetical protein
MKLFFPDTRNITNSPAGSSDSRHNKDLKHQPSYGNRGWTRFVGVASISVLNGVRDRIFLSDLTWKSKSFSPEIEEAEEDDELDDDDDDELDDDDDDELDDDDDDELDVDDEDHVEAIFRQAASKSLDWKSYESSNVCQFSSTRK